MRLLALFLVCLLVACATELEPVLEELPVEKPLPTFSDFYSYDAVRSYSYAVVVENVTAEIVTRVIAEGKIYVLETRVTDEDSLAIMRVDPSLGCLSFSVVLDGKSQPAACPAEGLNSEPFVTADVVLLGEELVTVPLGEFPSSIYVVQGLQFWIGDAPIPLKIVGEKFSLELVSFE